MLPVPGLCWLYPRLIHTDPAFSFTNTVRSSFASLLSALGVLASPKRSRQQVTTQMLKTTACRRLARRPPQMMRLGIALLCGCLCTTAQTAPPEVPSTENARQLAAEHRWQDIALLLGPLRSRSADQNFHYAPPFAQAHRYPDP